MINWPKETLQRQQPKIASLRSIHERTFSSVAPSRYLCTLVWESQRGVPTRRIGMHTRLCDNYFSHMFVIRINSGRNIQNEISSKGPRTEPSELLHERVQSERTDKGPRRKGRNTIVYLLGCLFVSFTTPEGVPLFCQPTNPQLSIQFCKMIILKSIFSIL